MSEPPAAESQCRYLLSPAAIRERAREVLRFDYDAPNWTGAERPWQPPRRVEPHHLVTWGGRWYLVSWDLDRADWRTFRVDRMRPGISAGIRFTARPLTNAEAEALVARGVPPEARRHQARIVVQLPADRLAERIGPWIGTVEADGEERCFLDAGADSLEAMAVHLGMLEADFTVTEPPELVLHLRSLAGRYGRATAPTA